MLTTLLTILRSLRPMTPADRERAYLDQSVDRFDLEYRERQIEQGLFREYLTPHFR